MYSIVFLLTCLLTLSAGPVVIPWLHKLKFGQTIRGDGPQSHLVKGGTPTMGGLMFIGAVVLVQIIISIFYSEALYPLSFLLLFGFIGFLDDFIKVVLKRNLGLRVYQKIVLQLAFALALALWHLKITSATWIYIPFTQFQLDLGWLYVPFVVVFIIAMTNSVNLTDGLDGLSSSVTLVVALVFGFGAGKMGHEALGLFMVSVAGGTLGFLWYNKYPAKIFMGDTGSMALGGAVAAGAVILRMELLIILVGFIYLMESVSVILQVASFKLTGKRIFKMAPIHHHFELMGWKETKVVKVFFLATIFLSLIGALAFRLDYFAG